MVHPPSIVEIARRAGVGKSTAARVLSGEGAVSERTRERVLEVARSLKYRANTAARALRKGENRILGIVVPNSASYGILSSNVSAPKLEGIARGAKRLGYDLQIFIEDLQDGEALRRMAVEKDVRAIFFLGGVKEPTLDLLDRYRIPWIGINWRLPSRPGDLFAWTDFAHAGRTLAGHLIQSGCRRVVAFDWLSAHYGPYGDGIAAAWASFGMPAEDLTLLRGEELTGGPAVSAALSRAFDGPARPDGLLMGHRDGLQQAYAELKRRGLCVGKDVAVATFDDLDAPQYLDPACTAYAQPFTAMGEAAVEEIDRWLSSGRPQAQPRKVPGELRVRASTQEHARA
ncbi:MAG: LacI family DNA-binding transcriptional regulator [Planctomycetes bacterium]|nr:LacI family DNA-binding transcriptional regulator [Planctomycetota bacterium]